MLSIQNRLTFIIAAGMALLLSLFSLMLDTLINERLRREFDQTLLAKSDTLITLTTQSAGVVEFDFADEIMPEYERAIKPEYFELWNTDGSLIERSHSVGNNKLPRTNVSLNKVGFTNFHLPNGREVRAVEQSFIPHMRDDASQAAVMTSDSNGQQTLENGRDNNLRVNMVVAKGMEELHELIRSIHMTLAMMTLVLLLFTLLMVRFSVSRAFRPIGDLTRQLEKLDANQLCNSVSVVEKTKELTPIVEQLNSLFGRLEHSFQREKRFSDDVAHELRTPLAELRAISDIGKMYIEDKAVLTRYFTDLGDISNQLEAVVTNLLMLARCEAGKEIVEWSLVDLNNVLLANWKLLRSEALSNNIELSLGIENHTTVMSDAAKIQLIFSNLLSNAVTYSAPNTTIFIEAIQQDCMLSIRIRNHVSDLNQEDLKLMFDRFWQKDSSRTHGQHSGLGLSLVMALTSALGLELKADLSDGNVFTLTLSGLVIP